MSDPNQHAERFEQLVRCIYDKPQYQRPETGKTPAYILAEEKKSLGTNARLRDALDAVKSNKSSVHGALGDYFGTFAENLEAFRIAPDADRAFDDLVFESIASFLPYRDEVIELFLTVGRYRSDAETYSTVHKFFESLLPYFHCPTSVSSWHDWDFDNFRFIGQELFMYAVAAFIKHSRFEGVNELLEQGYFPPRNYPYRSDASLFSFPVFDASLESFRVRNGRLGLRRISLKATTLHDRATRTDIAFEDLMQADLVLFIRDELTKALGQWGSFSWCPDTLIYAQHRQNPFEVFLRAESKRYFDQMKMMLGVDSPERLVQLLDEFKRGERQLPYWDSARFSPGVLIRPERMGTRA